MSNDSSLISVPPADEDNGDEDDDEDNESCNDGENGWYVVEGDVDVEDEYEGKSVLDKEDEGESEHSDDDDIEEADKKLFDDDEDDDEEKEERFVLGYTIKMCGVSMFSRCLRSDRSSTVVIFCIACKRLNVSKSMFCRSKGISLIMGSELM